MRKIVFIVGQGGSGKTTLVNYFKKHPVTNWQFFDFDNGAKIKPHAKDISKLKIWVEKQSQFWLKEVRSAKYSDSNIALFGTGRLLPWKIGNPKDIYFAYLDCDQSSRKERLIKRGDEYLWVAHQKDVSLIAQKLDKLGTKRFETGSCPIQESAQAIQNWLLSL